MKKKFIKVKKVSNWFDVYYTDAIKISYTKQEFAHMFGRFWSIGLFNTRFVLVPSNFRELFSC